MADDEAYNIAAITSIMQVVGLQNTDQVVDTAFNGQQLVDYIQAAVDQNDPHRYAVVLTDCSMPVMDGYEASRQIRSLLAAHESSLKIIAVTGHVESEYVQKALDHGMDLVWPKPLQVSSLAQILHEYKFIE